MGKAIDAINAGLRYQNLYFWMYASQMLHEHSNIKSVVHEDDRVKSIDDVVVEYIKPEVGNHELPNEQITIDFFQIKYHVKNNEQIELLDIIDPDFINASKYSFLQRVHQAIKKGYTTARFHMVTPWNIKKGDLLEKLLDNHHYKINLNLLFDDRPRTNFAKARAAMMKHLEILDESELRQVLRSIRIQHSRPSIDLLVREQLNLQLKLAGLIPVHFNSHTNSYNELITSCSSQGSKRFTKEDLLNLCKNEGLYTGQPLLMREEINIGIRSFIPYTESLETETEHLLCVSEFFDQRLLKPDIQWNLHVGSRLKQFIQDKFTPGNSYYVQFNTHLSINFATGLILNPKSGSKVYPVQRGNGLVAWIPDIHTGDRDIYTSFDLEEVMNESNESVEDFDIVVSIGISRAIKSHVEWHVKHNSISIQRFFHFELTNPGINSVKDGTHAWLLAEQVMKKLDERTPDQRKGKVHFFISAPGSFTFFLGQQASNIPKVVCYEHNLTGDGSYSQSFTLPL